MVEPGLSHEENHRRYGWTADPHGHDYRCAVTVTGSPDPRTGALVDLGTLDRVLDDVIVRPLDGMSLNDQVPAFAEHRQLPTCEALAGWIFTRLAAELPPAVHLLAVRVAEDDTLHADCTGTA